MNRKDVLIVTLAASNVVLAAAGTKILRTNIRLNARHRKMWEMSSYLIRMLEDRDVDLSEFDLIAFRELGLKEETRPDES